MNLVYNIKGEYCLHVARNNGDGTFTQWQTVDTGVADHATGKDDSSFTLLVYDMDGDGRSDVLLCKDNYVHHGGLKPRDEYTSTSVIRMFSDGSTLNIAGRNTNQREGDGSESTIFWATSTVTV